MTTTATATTAYDQLIAHSREADLLGSSAGMLGWDQETFMPPAGLAYRGKQLSQLARLTHRMRTDPRVGEWLDACEQDSDLIGDPLSVPAVNIRELRVSYDKATKLPDDLVAEISETSSTAKGEWAAARKENNYERFKPWLKKLIDLNLEKAKCYGWAEDGEPWDALADSYETGMTAASVAEVLTPLRNQLVPLLDEILGSKTGPSNAFNEIKLPIDRQMAFVKYVAEHIGFDFNRGRLDISSHPFCGGSHCNDVRMTTRFHEDNVNDALGSTMHESGHGIYNQGLLAEHIGTPMGAPVGLSIHESQSRMWENQVGRSEAFWHWCYPKLAEHFGKDVAHLSLPEVYGGANRVSPGLIRVEADEATYNLHIMVRFEIERALCNRSLSVDDLPEAWNARYKEYLNIDVPDDSRGCMQDIHWSMGAIGYFPTYTMGNIYAAQFFEEANEQLGDLNAMFAKGEFAPLKKWLNDKIHAHGKRYRSAELCEVVTGKPLSAEPLMRHLEGKLRPLYGI